MTRCHSTINLRVLTGDCKGVNVVVPVDRATVNAQIKVAGWSMHRVRRSPLTGKLYLAPAMAMEGER